MQKKDKGKKLYQSRLYRGLALPDLKKIREEKTHPLDLHAITRKARAGQPGIDEVILGDSRHMTAVASNSVSLAVTSPPYNVGKDYDKDLTLEQYMNFLDSVWRECRRVLRPGGRLCVNVAGVGRQPYLPLQAFITLRLLKMGFLMRGEVIWDKGTSVGSSTAWGSWCSATNPVLRDVHEYILIFSKRQFKLNAHGRQSTLVSREFTTLTKSIWVFPTESAKRVGHPAPFPEALPAKLVSLYTFKGDLVLDPFAGSGTTCVAARRLGRHYVGYDNDPHYVALAHRRLAQLELF